MMKPANPGSPRQKIILYYTLAVLLPGIILGYLAYRGIRNDQALREKENMKRLEINSRALFSAIDSSLADFVNDRISGSIPPDAGKDDPSILAMFSGDSSGAIKLKSYKLLYLPAEVLTVKPEYLSLPPDMKEGQQLEFIERKYPEALKFYQDKLLKTNKAQEKIQALIASARLYNKMNQPERAKTVYKEILTDYTGTLLYGQIPVALLASLEILKINKAMEEHEELKNNSLQYLELLLHPPCEYNSDQFEMFYQAYKEIKSESGRISDSLHREIYTQKSRTDYLIRVITSYDLNSSSENNHFIDNKNIITCKPINSADISAVDLNWQDNSGLRISLVIDFPVFLKSISEKLIQKLDPSYLMNLIIEDNDGGIILTRITGEEINFLSFPFPEHLPDWKLRLSENSPGFISALFKTGSGIYLFIFILIALFMILGFAFTMYTLNVEIRLNKLKSEFISNVSHELKSPLTAIRMMTEMLHHNRVESEERKSEYYSAMLEESEHLSHLIDNILDFSRIDEDRKKYDFTDLDLDELLVKLLGSTRERIKEQGFDIRYDRPDTVPLIRGDRDALVQVLSNLIDNAIKFSGKSKHIDVSLVLIDNELHLSVKDFGIGISPADQEKVFERFYRCREPQEAGIRGSGIGLAIVKRIVEDHGGYLTLESSPGEGSNFTVRIPFSGN